MFLFSKSDAQESQTTLDNTNRLREPISVWSVFRLHRLLTSFNEPSPLAKEASKELKGQVVSFTQTHARWLCLHLSAVLKLCTQGRKKKSSVKLSGSLLMS